MSEELTPRQQILLWDLISRGGNALQKDLRPEVKPADREPLRNKRLISVSREKRAIRLTIEDSGWNCLAARAPELSNSIGSKYDRPILQFVLAKLQAYAAREDVALASILAAIRTPAPPIAATAQDEIRATFFALAGRPARDKVRLSALRARLSHVPRADLDATLLAMRKAGTANLTNLDNPRDIETEHDAALQSGLQTFHTLWIEE